MKTILIAVFLMAATLTLPAQTNCNIKKAYAFYTLSLPGRQMADEHAKPIPPKPGIGRFIYIEWCGINSPEIESVLYNNKLLTATLTKVEGNAVIPGGNIGNNSEFKIAVQKCNSLWKLDLQAADADQMPAQDCKNIIIKIKSTTNTCQLKLIKERELVTLPRY